MMDDVNESTMAGVMIDLDTTTTNMGVMIIVAEGASILTRAAVYVMCQLNHTNNNQKGGDAANNSNGKGNKQ